MAIQNKPENPRVRKPRITAEQLRDIFIYDHEMGIFIRKNDLLAGPGHKCVRRRKGEVVTGHKYLDRYTEYVRIKVDGVNYRAHALVWLYVYGEWPYRIDHKDRDGTNNRISNLRLATRSQNSANSKLVANSSSGLKGAHRHPSGGWASSICLNKTVYYLGYFATPEEAHMAYLSKAKELFGEFARAS